SAPRTFVDLVRAVYPNCPATQPLDAPLDRKDGARLVLRDPIYLDRMQNLWITRPDAEPTEAVLSRVATDTEHLVRERPAYAHWRFQPGTKRRAGHSTVVLVCPKDGTNQIEFVEETRRTTLNGQRGKYNW